MRDNIISRYVKEATKQISRSGVLTYLARTLSLDTNFKIGKHDQLTGKTRLPSGELVDSVPVGSPTKYTATQLAGNSGIVFAEPATQIQVDGSVRPAYIAHYIGSSIYIRYLGGSDLFLVPVTIPANAIDIQAKFSSNCKHFMVGWWIKGEDKEAPPYDSFATYYIFNNFKCDTIADAFTYDSVDTQTFNLNELADGVLQCPGPGETFSEYIWFSHVDDSGAGGEFVRFFPILYSEYTTETAPYDWTVWPECSIAYQTTALYQHGEYVMNWVMDPETKAQFKSVIFTFNNKLNGDPVVDVVCSFRALVAGYMQDQEHYDDVNWLETARTAYAECVSSSVSTYDFTYRQYRKNTFEYDYNMDFNGPTGLDWSAVETSMPLEMYMSGEGTHTYTCADGRYGCEGQPDYVRTGSAITYPRIFEPGPFGMHFREEETGNGNQSATLWYTFFAGTSGYEYPILYPPDTTDYYLYTYDGVTKPARYAGNPEGLVAKPEPWAFVRLNNYNAGLVCNEFYHYTITPLGPFARSYYFAMGLMAIKEANITGSSNLEWDGRPPLHERDYNTNINTFLGIDGQRAIVWRQEAYPTDSVYVDPADDVSFQAILEILRDTGDEALLLLADYLENNAGFAGTFTINTKKLYWYARNYNSDPFYGYDSNYDVMTDAVVSPDGTFPFQNSYLKGLDSYIILGYNQSGTSEAVTVYEVAADGETSIKFKSSKSIKYFGSNDILDVGIRYERVQS